MKKIKLPVDDKGRIEIVFNTCYGGFSISRAAIDRMIELGSEEAKTCLENYKKYGGGSDSYYLDIARFNPILVQVVKELKHKANGECSSLAVGKINLDDLISIEDHDGKEEVSGCYDYICFDREEDVDE